MFKLWSSKDIQMEETRRRFKNLTFHHHELDVGYSGSLNSTGAEIHAAFTRKSRRNAKSSSTRSTNPGHEEYQPRNRVSQPTLAMRNISHVTESLNQPWP
ncbi:hypothetical protein RRG08_052850 [Elysia crispata]|uniref:Uncharacterized protein n=1 Tax=Elysia crispata TaxID=231223 RepID=A0AAE1EDS9_9GAST|nr:hypothetical protein RRG08_052850 [Elysia crispata]